MGTDRGRLWVVVLAVVEILFSLLPFLCETARSAVESEDGGIKL